MAVGNSTRTPFKHWVLDDILGKQFGVLGVDSPKVKAKPPFIIIDMCAGDGHATEHSERTSPGIITRHIGLSSVETVAIFVEKNEFTFQELQGNFPDIEAYHMDAKDFVLPAVASDQAVFVNCDPNHINEHPMTDSFIESLPTYSMMLITMGCNVGGLKRLDLKERQRWFDFLRKIATNISRFHDLIMVEIVKDSSQWAYLLRLPSVWAQREMKRLKKKGDALFPENGVNVCSLKTDKEQFVDIVKRLFLTKEERHNA